MPTPLKLTNNQTCGFDIKTCVRKRRVACGAVVHGSNQNIAIRPTAGDVDLKESGRSPHKVEVNSFCSLLLCFEEQFFPVKRISRE